MSKCKLCSKEATEFKQFHLMGSSLNVGVWKGTYFVSLCKDCLDNIDFSDMGNMYDNLFPDTLKDLKTINGEPLREDFNYYKEDYEYYYNNKFQDFKLTEGYLGTKYDKELEDNQEFRDSVEANENAKGI